MNTNNHTYAQMERMYGMKAAAGFAAGLVLGGLAGAVTMLFLAPQSGKRTRAQLQLKGMELREQAAEAVDDALVQVQTKAHQVKVGVSEKADELQQYGQKMLNGQKERWSAVGEAAKTAFQGSQG